MLISVQKARWGIILLGLLYVTGLPRLRADERDQLRIGLQPDGRIVVPTNQILKPAGKQILFPGRPVDLAWAEDGRVLVVKNMRDLVFLDVASGTIKQTLALPAKGDPRPGFSVVGLVVNENRVYASDAQDAIRVAERQPDGQYRWAKSIGVAKPKVGGLAHPAGMALLNKNKLWVTVTRANNLQLVDLPTGKIEQEVPVGVAPFTVVCVGERCFVSNWGGDAPKEGEPQAVSSGTPIRIDAKTGIANHGSISVVEKKEGRWQQVKSIAVGMHPCGMVISETGKFLYVANANSDTVSVIDTAKLDVVETIPCRPENRLPFGSGSNALTLGKRNGDYLKDGYWLYVANGTNNCIATVILGTKALERYPPHWPEASEVAWQIPTGWYPGAVLLSPDGKQLIVANIKGHGSLHQPRPVAQGRRSHDHLGSVSIIDLPQTKEDFARYTEEVKKNNRLAYSLAGLEKPRADRKPMPVPECHGEPSVFKHVIYVVKENRTYDQIFGDMKEGNGDPNLVLFGAETTPNHHALARQFTLFDNFYCSGVLSADGHSWVNEAYVTDYLERAFGGFTRSYPDDGSDPLAYPSSGFLWDNALAHKKTIRNYGEFVNEVFAPKGTTWTQLYEDFKNGTQKVKVEVKANLKSLEPFTHPRYPWFPLLMPDVYRAKIFIDELKEFEKKGSLPNLIYVTLPCDHTEGTRPGFPTPRAMVADNDLALGRIVEAVSRSKFWPETCIFVVEDDPQDGFDHVDAHRTVALVISPYTRRRFVDHTNYNQTGMVKTIELILGLPPMNQLDLSATAMRGCFQDVPDLTPFTCLPNRVLLDELNPPLRALKGQALYWAKKSLELNLDEGDKAEEDTLNRILWHATRGYETPYPAQHTRQKAD